MAFTMPTWWPLVSPFATAVGAVAGGWLGARFALRRFKAERAHDRRLEWHLGALRAVHALQRATGDVGYDDAPRSAAYRKASNKVQRLVDEAPAFMTLGDLHGFRMGYVSLFDPVDRTDEARRAHEHHELLAGLLAAEGGAILEMAEAVLRGLRRLMPVDEPGGFGRALRRPVHAARAWLRHRRRAAENGERGARGGRRLTPPA